MPPTRPDTPPSSESAAPSAGRSGAADVRVEPPPEVPADPERWRPWLERVRQSVADLAADQKRLHERFHELADFLEAQRFAAADDAPPERPRRLAEPRKGATPAKGLFQRILYAVLRRTVGRVRNLWRASLAELVIDTALDAHRTARLLSLGRVVEVEDLDAADDADAPGLPQLDMETIFWHRASGTCRRFDGRGHRAGEGKAPQVEDLRRAVESEVCVVNLDRPAGGPWPAVPAGVVELALHSLDAQNLRFLRLRHDAFDLFFVRWSWWHPDHGLAPRRLARAAKDRPLGRTVTLGRGTLHDAPRLHQPGAADLERYGTLWTAADAEGTMLHEVAAGRPAPPSGDGRSSPDEASPAALVLTRPLDAGLAEIVRAWLADHPDALLLGLAMEGVDAARPLAARRGTPWIFPICDFVEEVAYGATAAQVLSRHGVRRLFHAGPGRGLFDQDEFLHWARGADLEIFDLPLPRFPEPTVDLPRPDGVRPWQPPPVEPLEIALRDAGAARRELGIVDESPVVAWIGDLVPGERPDDFAELAAVLGRERQDLHFVLAGTGPLDESLEDLRSWHGLERWIRTSDRALACAAADLVVFTAEDRAALALSPWPPTARAAGRRVIAYAGCGLDDAADGSEDGELERVERRDLQALAESVRAALP